MAGSGAASAADAVEYAAEVAPRKRVRCARCRGDKSATPLPRGPLAVMGLLLIHESIISTYFQPFLPSLIEHLGVAPDSSSLGFYVGLISSGNPLALIVAAFIWGWMSDRIGRRPMLLFGIIGGTLCQCLFGLTVSFEFCFALRILGGLFNVNISVIKTYLGEISDRTNRTRAFTMVNLAWGIGAMVGPLLGGFLADPVAQYPGVFEGTVFESQPFLLAAISSTFLAPVVFVLVFCVVKETLPIERNRCLQWRARRAQRRAHRVSSDNEELDSLAGTALDAGDVEMRAVSARPRRQQRTNKRRRTVHDQLGDDDNDDDDAHGVPHHDNDDGDADDVEHGAGSPALLGSDERDAPVVLGDREERAGDAALVPGVAGLPAPLPSTPAKAARSRATVIDIGSPAPPPPPPLVRAGSCCLRTRCGRWLCTLQILRMLTRRVTLLPCVTYSLIGLTFVFGDSLYPMWADLARDQGGLGYTAREISYSMAAGQIVMMIVQLTFYPSMQNKLGVMRTLYVGLFCTAPVLLAFPYLSLLADYMTEIPMQVVLSLSQIIYQFAGICSFGGIYIVINESDPANRGAMTGLSQSSVSLMRAVGPTVAGLVFTQGVNHHVFPLDVRFAHLIGALISASTGLLTLALRSHPANHREPVAPPEGSVAAYAITVTESAEKGNDGDGLLAHALAAIEPRLSDLQLRVMESAEATLRQSIELAVDTAFARTSLELVAPIGGRGAAGAAVAAAQDIAPMLALRVASAAEVAVEAVERAGDAPLDEQTRHALTLHVARDAMRVANSALDQH